MIERTLQHLRTLVAFDTMNPPRAITSEHGIIAYVGGALRAAGFAVASDDLGDGCVCLHARRGDPTLLVNCHLDTVPADPSWTRDPLRLRVENGRAIGLGACDIKGAAACLLSAAEATSGDAALLLTTDEEAGQSHCVRRFLDAHGSRYAAYLVCEPTGCRAVTQHRGLVSAEAHFRGESGHSSRPARSATHEAARWVVAALDLPGFVEEHRLNVGAINGGLKPNMIAASTVVRFGLRPAPGHEAGELLHTLGHLVHDPEKVRWETRFVGAPLREHADSPALVERLGLGKGPPVDFWTEAALFAETGRPAIVFGPGDITQAHTAGEWTPLTDLATAASAYAAGMAEHRDAVETVR